MRSISFTLQLRPKVARVDTRVVSSAYITKSKLFLAEKKSLITILNKGEPITDPFGNSTGNVVILRFKIS